MSSHREAPEISMDPVADSTDLYAFVSPDRPTPVTLSTPNYAGLAASAVHDLGRGIKVFAGQRAEGFYVDLGAIFDLGDLRPFENLHNQYGMHVFSGPAPGVNATNKFNVHSIAIQVPIRELVQQGASGESDP